MDIKLTTRIARLEFLNIHLNDLFRRNIQCHTCLHEIPHDVAHLTLQVKQILFGRLLTLEDNLFDDFSKLTRLSTETYSSSKQSLGRKVFVFEVFETLKEYTILFAFLRGDLIDEFSILKL